MQTGFFGKCFISLLAGLATATLYVFVWQGIIVGADKALNEGYKQRSIVQ